MTINEQVEYWIRLSEADIPVAESLFQNKHFTWSLFIGHLILEKVIKAAFIKDNLKQPPKTHDLVKLIESTKIKINKVQKDFLDTVNDFNIEARYPDEKMSLAEICTENFTEKYLMEIKELHKWIKSQITF